MAVGEVNRIRLNGWQGNGANLALAFSRLSPSLSYGAHHAHRLHRSRRRRQWHR